MDLSLPAEESLLPKSLSILLCLQGVLIPLYLLAIMLFQETSPWFLTELALSNSGSVR